MTLSDAHCHLQDTRLAVTDAALHTVLDECRHAGICRWMVNATKESDWASVLDLSRRELGVQAAIGLHPWWQKERSSHWESELMAHLQANPEVTIGETGLDRWMAGHDLLDQLKVLKVHLLLSQKMDRPISLHCLRAWPELFSAVRQTRPSKKGFLLHSYTGPPELLAGWIELGAFFSFSPAFLHPRKSMVRAAFGSIPLERLLIETDAPDMGPPSEMMLARLEPNSETGNPTNHPGNLKLCLKALAADRHMAEENLAAILEENWTQLFERADA